MAKWTRQSAIEFLTSSANFREIRAKSSNAKPLHDMDTTTLSRYASRLQEAERNGEWLRDAAALRGHQVSENKPKNRARKPGFEDWAPPRTIRRGLEVQKHFGSYVAIRRTGSQAEVVAFLARMARSKDKGPRQVAINIFGRRKGEYAQLMWKGGYSARKLLEAAGYVHTRSGRWRKAPGERGIQAYLLDVLAASQRYPARWDRIALYEVWAWQQDLVLKRGPASQAPNGQNGNGNGGGRWVRSVRH